MAPNPRREESPFFNSTSCSKRYSECPPSRATSRRMRPRFSVTETSVPSFGNNMPVFGDRMIFVRLTFTPGCITSFHFLQIPSKEGSGGNSTDSHQQHKLPHPVLAC